MAPRISRNQVVFILAAGIGSRLKELTTNKPKAMVNVGGMPMIDRLLNTLQKQEFNQFIVNLHHHGDVLQQHLEIEFPELNIAFSNERNELLDTGGAILKIEPMLEKNTTLLIHNVDVILPFEPIEMLATHLSNKAICTLAVSDRTSSRKLLFNAKNQLCGWKNVQTGEIRKAINYNPKHRELAFSGVHWMNSEFYNYNTHKGRFSIIDSWLTICHDAPIFAFEHKSDGWFDLGTAEKIKDAESKLKVQ